VNERIVRPMMKRIGVADPSDDVVRTFTALLRHTDTMRNEQTAGPRILSLRGMVESTLFSDEVLAAMTAPTLLLWGTADPFGDAPIARAFAARLPDATLELLDGVGHAPWLDEPERCASAVLEFLERPGR
jgi:2-hydroxy-6-oxonona-2,4-dienedioate hydrolase